MPVEPALVFTPPEQAVDPLEVLGWLTPPISAHSFTRAALEAAWGGRTKGVTSSHSAFMRVRMSLNSKPPWVADGPHTTRASS